MMIRKLKLAVLSKIRLPKQHQILHTCLHLHARQVDGEGHYL